ncbi:MAG: N-acetylglucosamine-6-phosphate deacetylase [Cypionkella sp.]
MTRQIFQAKRIFDGQDWHDNAALVVGAGRVVEITAATGTPDHDCIVPGLIDLQVNGGGGVQFNNTPTAAGIATIAAAHARLGTTALMVTLITDSPAVTAQAIAAAKSAAILGLHLEGPHLDPARKGTHDPALIRPMTDADLAILTGAAHDLPHLICTIAPESVTLAQTQTLASAGATISLGHSDCTCATALAYADAGARMVTHLFNAMSQMQHRAPGLVGAALSDRRLWSGLIADGFHVDDTVMRVALRAQQNLFLVSDAMATIGSDLTEFTLNGRQIFRAGGRLTLADGTLAGADIALIDAVRHVHQTLGLPLAQALQLASLHPARALGLTDRGHLHRGAQADFFCLTPQITANGTWIGGVPAP